MLTMKLRPQRPRLYVPDVRLSSYEFPPPTYARAPHSSKRVFVVGAHPEGQVRIAYAKMGLSRFDQKGRKLRRLVSERVIARGRGRMMVQTISREAAEALFTALGEALYPDLCSEE